MTDDEPTRRERRTGVRHHRRALIGALAAILVLVTAAGVALAASSDEDPPQAAGRDRADRTTTTTSTTEPPTTTTTTTLPRLEQPVPATLPPVPGSLGPGSSGEVVAAYQQRLKDLHFDPGAVDGNYGPAMTYAVQTLQKLVGLPVNGRLATGEAMWLATFRYPDPLWPVGEPNRTEIDIPKQVLTLYENSQVRLITTTSTGSGEHYCYNTPRINPTQHICEVATTPSGRFTYTRWVKGWDKSPLGQLYQPYYFNGGIAVHGYESVPTTPASHGCARIPMHIAEYFPLLVRVGDPVYVFGGQPAQILSSSPIRRAPTPAPTAPPAPAPAPAPAPGPEPAPAPGV